MPSSGGRCWRYIRPRSIFASVVDDLDVDGDVAVRRRGHDLRARSDARGGVGLVRRDVVALRRRRAARSRARQSEQGGRSDHAPHARHASMARHGVRGADARSRVAAAYAAALAPLGLEVVAMPVTRIAAAADPDALARARSRAAATRPSWSPARARRTSSRARATPRRGPARGVGGRRRRRSARSTIAQHRRDAPRPACATAPSSRARSSRARACAGKRVLVPRAEEGRDRGARRSCARPAPTSIDVDRVSHGRRSPPTIPQLARGLALLRAGGAAVCACSRRRRSRRSPRSSARSRALAHAVRRDRRDHRRRAARARRRRGRGRRRPRRPRE